MVEITVYFTDEVRFAEGSLPFEVAVTRLVPSESAGPDAALRAFFQGPTEEERERGLVAITSGFEGLDSLEIEDGIARVYLSGPCASMGATYTVAQPLLRNLLQFEAIRYVKIYDAEGQTGEPGGPSHSIPPCLEP